MSRGKEGLDPLDQRPEPLPLSPHIPQGLEDGVDLLFGWGHQPGGRERLVPEVEDQLESSIRLGKEAVVDGERAVMEEIPGEKARHLLVCLGLFHRLRLGQ